VRRLYGSRWKRSARPIVVHLLARLPSEVKMLTQRLEDHENIAAWEIGLPPETIPSDLVGIVSAAGPERPVILRLPLDRARELTSAAQSCGAAAISLGPPRGLFPGEAGRFVQGRLYGPALFPQALEAVHTLVQAGLAVIGSGGLYQPWQAKAMLAAGAIAVQLDAVLWLGLSDEGWLSIAAAGRTEHPAPPAPAQSPPAG
jgi:dihydroorotate dehydrogenase